MSNRVESGLGELLRHLVELTDNSTETFYKGLDFNYRARYTPIMRALESGAASVTSLRERLSITQGAVSQTIKLMAADGLIETNKGADARQTIVSLSDHGNEVLKHLKPQWNATFRAIEKLEDEIGFPLISCLKATINALENKSYVDRIDESTLR